MTTSDLAKMLDGWPEAARPYGKVWSWASVGDVVFEEGGCDEAEALAIDIDLACMAGLRRLETYIDLHGGAGFTRIRHKHASGAVEVRAYVNNGSVVISGSGPTLLHAIDAAVRGCK